ncbi:hypothetical protein HU200_060147 [Digitaria exilis]|uniref:PGG domain-containing protein n=1 Tax=Digitaria exilis TaxID=1010633 RepID=A0A835DXR0_9POAL|nr:hypothetical protein HU200_060147 [Digitaria exilis]
MAMEVELQNGNKHVAESTTSQKEPHQQGDQIPINLEEAELVWKLRKYLILLAILSATITYQAGLAPPGGLWLDNLHGHLASDIVLQSTYSKRYNVFFYCNSTAFMASLIVLILLLVRELSRNAIWLRSLHFAMLLNLLGLMGAYAAGSCRQIKTSLYTWVLLVGIFTYVVLHVVFFQHLASEWLRQTLMDVQRSWKDYLARMFGKNHSTTEELDASVKEKKDELEQKRSLLLVLATLSTTVTYAAGLNPPGGFWPDSDASHLAGDPVLRDHYPRRFKAFMACNDTAFAGSLVIIIMLLSNTAVDHVVKSNALRICVVISLFGLMAAYAAGSCREVHTSIYVFTLVGAVLLYLVIQWIAPIVPRPEFVRKCIKWAKGENNRLILKLKSFLMYGTSTTSEQEMTLALDNTHPSSHDSTSTRGDVKDDIRKLRTYLLLLGILAATITYQAGLNPPGGFWLDNEDGHIAGDPILEAISPRRYSTFFYCNATAFVSSLVIITLLQSNVITVGALKRYVLQTAMIFDLFGMMGAYAAGSSWTFSTSLYVIILVILAFSYVIIHILLFVCTRNSDESAQQIHDNPELKDLEKRRKFLVLLAVLAASSTYQAGMNPPGGFWTDNNDGHRAGYPMFHDEFPHRYMVFFYLNSTAFMSSLAVIMLLVSKRLCQRGIDGYLLRGCMLIDLVSLMGAFAAGSCRKVSISVYAILVVAIVFAYVMAQVLVLTFAKDKVGYFFEWVLCATPFKSLHPSENCKRGSMISRKLEHKWRKDLILIGTLAVSVTYQAGLLPPGGLWPDDRDGHFIGDPILHDTDPPRYKAFFYCNATAFMASLVIVILLLNNTISKYKRSLLPMKTAMVLDLLALLGAYASGSCRKLKTSIYIFALFIAVFMYVVIHIFLSFNKMAQLVKKTGERWIPCLNKIWALIEIEPPNHPPFNEEP